MEKVAPDCKFCGGPCLLSHVGDHISETVVRVGSAPIDPGTILSSCTTLKWPETTFNPLDAKHGTYYRGGTL